MTVNLLREAAREALERGWYIFGVPANSKKPYQGTNGSKDARNDDLALTRWETHPDSNPCVRLDRSGLTVLDADHGLKSIEDAKAWAARNGIPATYIVVSGRETFGCHFYFRGVRDKDHPDVTYVPRRKGKGRVGFQLDGVRGDIKCHGHVVLAGGIHPKTGQQYRGVGDPRHIAPLPDFLRDYEDPSVTKRRTFVEKQAKKRAEKFPEEQTGPHVIVPSITQGTRHSTLLREAGRLRQMGAEEDTIFSFLKDLGKHCIGGNKPDDELRGIAAFVAAKPCLRQFGVDITNLRAPEPTDRQVVARMLKDSFALGQVVSIEVIMAQIDTLCPTMPDKTRQRAIEDADFKTVGRDPANGRKWLWARQLTHKRETQGIQEE
jgi:hypothetical protein